MARWVTVTVLVLVLALFGAITVAFGEFPVREVVLPALTALIVFAVADPRHVPDAIAFGASYGGAYASGSLLGQGRAAEVGASWLVVPLVLLAAFCAASLLRSLKGSTWPGTVGMVTLGLLTSFFSGPPGGAGKFVRFLREVLQLSVEAADTVNFFVRKGIHLTVYGTLALCAGYVAWQVTRRKPLAWAASLTWGLGHAILDETTQLKTSTRTGSVGDVVLDLVGMTVVLALLHWRLKDRDQ